MTSIDPIEVMRDLINQANVAFADNDMALYEDSNEQIRIMCDEHPELTVHANAAGVYGGGPVQPYTTTT